MGKGEVERHAYTEEGRGREKGMVIGNERRSSATIPCLTRACTHARTRSPFRLQPTLCRSSTAPSPPYPLGGEAGGKVSRRCHGRTHLTSGSSSCCLSHPQSPPPTRPSPLPP